MFTFCHQISEGWTGNIYYCSTTLLLCLPAVLLKPIPVLLTSRTTAVCCCIIWHNELVTAFFLDNFEPPVGAVYRVQTRPVGVSGSGGDARPPGWWRGRCFGVLPFSLERRDAGQRFHEIFFPCGVRVEWLRGVVRHRLMSPKKIHRDDHSECNWRRSCTLLLKNHTGRGQRTGTTYCCRWNYTTDYSYYCCVLLYNMIAAKKVTEGLEDTIV